MRFLAAILLSVGTTIRGVTALLGHWMLPSRSSLQQASSTARPAFFNSGEYDSNNNDDGHHDALAHNLRRTDPLIFLTQRAIQSFMYLLASTRDPHTIKWIEASFVFVLFVHVGGDL